jgi:hypothetical protein
MAVTAIPTDYNGVRFRSRLEAKWAALFDRCGWRWSYEPNDFDGYIPDFALRFRTPILVEVKPLQWDDSDSDAEILQGVRTKIVHAGIKGEVIALGSWVPSYTGDSDLNFHRLGMLMSVDAGTDEASPWDWAFAFKCEHCGQNSFASEMDSYHCRVKGCYDERDGRRHIGDWDAELDWRRACSEVQWRPR